MKNKFFLWLSLLITLSIISYSCRNEDLAKDEANPQRNNADFFKHQSNLYSKAGIDYVNILETYNRETDFLSTIPDQEGMPLWEKMQVLDVDDKAVLYVPLSSDNISLSSLILVTVDENNKVSVLRNFTNDYLKIYTYNTDYPADKRRFLMDTFIEMDFLCFKQQEFTNLPTDLYKGSAEYNRLNIVEVTKESMNNGKFIYGSLCATMHVCVNGCTLLTCDYNNCQHQGKCHVWKSCANTVDWVDDPTTFYPSAPSCGPGCGGGGGGTPGSGGAPPKDPCALTGGNKPFYRMLTGCNNNGNTDLPTLDDPCQKTNDMLARPNVQQGIANVKANAALTLTNPTTGEIGFKENKDGTVVPADVNSAHQVVYNNVINGYGGYHNHTATGIHMVSPPDIVDILFGFAAAQSVNDGVGNAYYGMIAAESCSSCSGGIKYVHYVIRYSGTGSELGNFVYSPTQMTQFIIDYRKTASDLVDPYISGTTYSNSLGDLNEKGLEKLFFNTLQNMGLTGKVVLQRIENSGIVYNVTQDSAGTITATPCP